MATYISHIGRIQITMREREMLRRCDMALCAVSAATILIRRWIYGLNHRRITSDSRAHRSHCSHEPKHTPASLQITKRVSNSLTQFHIIVGLFYFSLYTYEYILHFNLFIMHFCSIADLFIFFFNVSLLNITQKFIKIYNTLSCKFYSYK